MRAPRRHKDRPPRAWVGVVSRAHVLRGVAGGFAQLCHGKHGLLARMSVGDWLVYYSPTTDFPDGAQLRAFTAIGRVVGENAYAFDMGGGFVPYRREVAYLKEVREVPFREVASELEFITSHGNWGMLARRGHFEIEMADLHRIGIAMGAQVNVISTSAARIAPRCPVITLQPAVAAQADARSGAGIRNRERPRDNPRQLLGKPGRDRRLCSPGFR